MLTNFEDQQPPAVREHAPTILRGLKRYSKDQPKKSKDIEQALGISGVTVRAAVSYLREKGEPIGSGSGGYYYDPHWKEMPNTIAHLRQRATRMETVAKALEKAMTQRGKGVDDKIAKVAEVFDGDVMK